MRAQQLWLIVSGNDSWLNWLMVVLGVAGFSDEVLRRGLPWIAAPPALSLLMWALALATVGLSVPPVMNLLSPRQRMNFSYNRLHLVNTHGAFGSVTRERYEVVIKGTADARPGVGSEWREC